MKIDVFKFGGVAVGSADAIRRAATHVMRHHGRLVIVVSAANGVTDLLHAAGAAALRGDATATAKASDAYRDRHQALIAGSVTDRKAARRLRELLDASATEMDAVTQSISVLRELTPRANDALVARGERMLAAIFAEVLRASGRDVAIVDAVDVIHTQHRLGTIWPDFPRCERAAKTHIMPLLHADSLCIVPGYIGRGPDGEVVTLGRGGSDFSAAILGRSLGATAVTLFKEVDGLLTADPKSVPGARLLADVHYREAAELAYYGAKVLHP